MSLVPTDSPSMSFNKKDASFLVKLSLFSAVGAVLATLLEEQTILKGLLPPQYGPLVTAMVIPLLVFAQQFIADNRKKVKEEFEKDKEDPNNPLPPMTMFLLPLMLLFSGESQAQVNMFHGYSDTQAMVFKPYSLVRLECEEDGKSFVWIIRRLPDGFRPDSVRLNSGKELVWTGPPGIYDVDTIYTDKEGVLQQVFIKVTIEGGDVVVPPGPGPTPPGPTPPGPTPPQPGKIVPLPKPTGDKYGFSGISYDLAVAIPEKDRLLAEKIADNYGSVSAAIFAGGIVDIDKAMADLRSRNQALFNDPQFPAWKTWFEKLGFQVNQDWNNRKFSTRNDIAEVFREIQVGLMASIGKKPE